MSHEGVVTIEREEKTEKSVADKIIDRFADDIKKEEMFNRIADRLLLAINQKRPSKRDINSILVEDEDQKS